ncbi:probable LRR receptor-like serine/threonine-protein kinase At3g47570 [Capsicum annuum]|uniref:probable LRR receptor-like serine/threonine-protein kinase At3g47570 n=1 Tax=Capsicum annuum TaxID=4072 RepID=UPI001FB052B1|nr:probable LRR receptor-like serine/threonine-protein kinase At3g47570 [Capsicum annuum]
MSVQEYTLKFNQLDRYATELTGNIRAQMRNFASSLSDDLTLECQGVMLNRAMNFARMLVYIQQVEEKKKKINESREKDRQVKRSRTVDQNPSQQQSVVFVPLTFVLLWIRYRRGKSAPQQADSLSTVARERISYYELLRATNVLSESNLIGSGSFGSVYKGILRSGTFIAVKVFNLQLDVVFKSFYMECEVLRSLRHRNLVKVITSCSNLDFKALVLEYMPNGSLEKYLYSHNYFLDIRKRLSILIDVACAFEYLHHGCSSPVIHCDLKPSNVLLDELESVLHLLNNCLTIEYRLNGLVSTKCDVYNYGIMLLEKFAGRNPNEFEGDLSLKQWVSYSLPKAVMDVVDANLVTAIGKGLQKEQHVVASILKVALDCCAESPARRTNMKDIVAMLQKIKIQLLAC